MTYAEHLAWLITMAKDPGWKDQSWHSAKVLDADKSGLWTGMAEDLKRAMLAFKLSDQQKLGVK